MGAFSIAAILDILIRIVALAPGLASSYQKIVNSLHASGELTASEWEQRKAEYLSTMQDAAWAPDPPKP
jgi:hypothetical protein